MARLIDADKRIAEIKKLYCDGCDNYGGAKCRACWVDDAMCLIDDATTVDSVEVVYCRYCKHFDAGDGFNRPLCTHMDGLKTAHESLYCPFGERKTD